MGDGLGGKSFDKKPTSISELAALFLLLDGSNGPITGPLQITNSLELVPSATKTTVFEIDNFSNAFTVGRTVQKITGLLGANVAANILYRDSSFFSVNYDLREFTYDKMVIDYFNNTVDGTQYIFQIDRGANTVNLSNRRYWGMWIHDSFLNTINPGKYIGTDLKVLLDNTGVLEDVIMRKALVEGGVNGPNIFEDIWVDDVEINTGNATIGDVYGYRSIIDIELPAGKFGYSIKLDLLNAVADAAAFLYGINIDMPVAYVGTTFAAKFTGDGRTVEICNNTYSIETSADDNVKFGGETIQKVNSDDVSNPPTDAELDAVFGTPATVGAGFMALIDDNGGGANFYRVESDGANWWITSPTKAV